MALADYEQEMKPSYYREGGVEESQTPAIQRTLETTEELLIVLSQSLELLQERLLPVMRPDYERVSPDNKEQEKRAEEPSPLQNRLLGINRNIEQNITFAQNTRTRLEI